jgi:hypothetical protein
MSNLESIMAEIDNELQTAFVRPDVDELFPDLTRSLEDDFWLEELVFWAANVKVHHASVAFTNMTKEINPNEEEIVNRIASMCPTDKRDSFTLVQCERAMRLIKTLAGSHLKDSQDYKSALKRPADTDVPAPKRRAIESPKPPRLLGACLDAPEYEDTIGNLM